MGAVTLNSRSWPLGDDVTAERLPCARYGRRRHRPYCTVGHTWEGIPARMVHGPGRPAMMRRIAEIWIEEDRSGAEFLVTGKHVGQTRDPGKRWGWHAHSPALHPRAIGIELDQHHGTGEITWETLHTGARLVTALHRAFGIQLVVQWPHVGPVERIRTQRPVITIGHVGHRDCVSNGDPVDEWVELLVEEYGWHPVDFSRAQDLLHWERVQRELRDRHLYTGAIDGIPGRGTTRALWRAGYVDGLWGLGLAAEAPDVSCPDPWVW